MQLAFDILQAAGLGAACGISPFLPVLVAGGLARAKLGLDFDHTAYAFLEDPWFLLAIAGAFVATTFTRGLWAGTRGDLLATAGVVLGGLEGAGSLADNHHSPAIGWIAAAACGVLAALAARDLLARVRARLDDRAAAALPLYAHGAALVAAALTVALPPLSIVVVGFLAWLLIGGRRRSREKYAGLRSLR